MFGKCQTTASCDDRRNLDWSKLIKRTAEQIGKRLLDISEMALIIREEDFIFIIKNCNFTVVEPMSIPKVCRFLRS